MTVFKAKLILEYLKDFPLEKQVEAAAHIIPKTRDMAERIIRKLVENPDAPNIWEIERMVRGEDLTTFSRTLSFDQETWKAIEKACMNLQKEAPQLIVELINEWLKKNFYL